MMLKAKFIGYAVDGTREYEYHGHTYTVNPKLYTSSAQQHKNEQLNIDHIIEIDERQRAFSESDKSESWEVGFNTFWESIGGE